MLLDYNFTGGSLAPSSVDADFTGGTVARSGFTSPSSFTTDWIYARGSDTGGSVDVNKYFGFTITPDPGVTYSLTSLTFGAAFYESSGASNGAYTTNYVVRSSVSGYSTDIASFAENGQTTTTPTFHSKTIDLSGLSYQSLGTPITFRIYIWDGITGATRLSAIDNLTLNGTVAAVPEPSTSALIGLSLFSLVSLRRGMRTL